MGGHRCEAEHLSLVRRCDNFQKKVTNNEVLTWENIIYGNHMCEAEPLLTLIDVSALSGIFVFLATQVLTVVVTF